MGVQQQNNNAELPEQQPMGPKPDADAAENASRDMEFLEAAAKPPPTPRKKRKYSEPERFPNAPLLMDPHFCVSGSLAERLKSATTSKRKQKMHMRSSSSSSLATTARSEVTPQRSSSDAASPTAANRELTYSRQIIEMIAIVKPVIRRSLQPAADRTLLARSTGLVNLGNTCFVNAVLQLLSNTQQLRRYFISKSHVRRLASAWALEERRATESDARSGVSERCAARFDLCIEFGVLLKALWKGYEHVSPVAFLGAFEKIAPDTLRTRNAAHQQDAQEFLTFLLDNLHEVLNDSRAPRNTPRLSTNVQSNSPRTQFERGKQLWNEHVLHNNSAISRLFDGQLVTSICCRSCGTSSCTFDMFMYLSVPIPASEAASVTLYDCLTEYFHSEVLRGDSAYNCERCDKQTPANLYLRLSRPPRYLLVHLKRFEYTTRGASKVTQHVEFPLENLRLQRFFMLRNLLADETFSYRLLGAVNHYGTHESGHYTAFCRSSQLETCGGRSKWLKFDDKRVTLLNPDDIVSPAAYILLYEFMRHLN